MPADKKLNEKDEDRMDSYPRPSPADNRYNNQPEYIDQQPNDFRDKSVSDLPANDQTEKMANEPEEK